MRAAWCATCQINAPDEQQTNDCLRCGESMWSSREMAETVLLARALRSKFYEVSEEARMAALYELPVCFGCFAMNPDADQPPCCEREASNREQLRTFDRIFAVSLDKALGVAVVGDKFSLYDK